MDTYEKAYKEALQKAKKLYEQGTITESLSYVFPELRESKDERIRRELIEHIKANCESEFVLFQKFAPDDVVAWLESQGEQRSILDELEMTLSVSEDDYLRSNLEKLIKEFKEKQQ